MNCDIVPSIITPTGAEVKSKLYKDLVIALPTRAEATSHYNYIHSDEFINKFGDWINLPHEHIGHLDVNGEPFIDLVFDVKAGKNVKYNISSYPEKDQKIIKAGHEFVVTKSVQTRTSLAHKPFKSALDADTEMLDAILSAQAIKDINTLEALEVNKALLALYEHSAKSIMFIKNRLDAFIATREFEQDEQKIPNAGRSTNDIVADIVAISKEFEIVNAKGELDPNGDYYRRNGKMYNRVTTSIGNKSPTKNALLTSGATIGNAIDGIIRDYFDTSTKLDYKTYKDNISKEAFDNLVNQLKGLNKQFKEKGETIVAKNIILHDEVTGIAGTVDLLTTDADGKVRIYDVKSMRQGLKDYDKGYEGGSKRFKHQKQLSMYRILLNNTYGINAESLGVLPVKVDYEGGDISTDEAEILPMLDVKPLDKVEMGKMRYSDTVKSAEEIEDDRRQITEFLIELHTFVKSMQVIGDLPRMNDSEKAIFGDDAKKAGEILNELKGLEEQVSELNKKGKDLYMTHIKDHIARYSTNPKVVKDSEEFFSEQWDENHAQLLFAGMGDTNNPLIASVVKMITARIDQAGFDARDDIAEFHKKLKTFKENGGNENNLYERYTIGEFKGQRTGGWVSELKGADLHLHIKAFYKKLDKSKLTIEAKRAKEAEFWNANKVNFKKEDGTSGSKYNEKWKSEAYKNLDKNTLEFLEYMKSLVNNVAPYKKDNIISRGMLPAIKNDQDYKKNQLKGLFGVHGSREKDTDRIIDEANKEVQFLQLKYVSALNKKEQFIIPDRDKTNESYEEYEKRALKEINLKYSKEAVIRGNKEISAKEVVNFTTLKAVKDKNDAFAEWNKSLKSDNHGENMIYDLATVIPAYLDMAHEHKARKSVEAEAILLTTQVRNQKIAKTSNGSIINIKHFEQITGKKKTHTSGTNTNTEKHVVSWLRMSFYEDFEKDEGKLQEWAKVVQNWSSLKNIGWNVFAGYNNIAYGELQSQVEAIGGYHYNATDYYRGRKDYLSAVGSFLGDTQRKDGSAGTIQGGIIKYFDILESQTELADGEKDTRGIYKWLVSNVGGFFMQQAGEHAMQNGTLLTMMGSHRVDNGKIKSFNEYLIDKKKPINTKDMTLDEVKAAVKENKEIEKTAKEEFEKLTTLREAFDFEAGYVSLKEGININKEELALFKGKVRGVNHKIHGIYNKSDRGTIENGALGRILMQHRHWMYPGWTKRFGTKFGKSFWNERRSEFDRGAYTDFYNYIGKPFRDNIRDSPEGIGSRESWEGLIKDIGKYATNAQLYWHTLDSTQQANVMRTLGEFLGMVAIGVALNFLRGGDDDDKDQFGYTRHFFIYTTDRLLSEFATYTPIWGWFNESHKILKSPSAGSALIEDFKDLIWATASFPFGDPESNYYQNGMYNDRLKLSVIGTKMTPFMVNQGQRFYYLPENNEYYKLE